MRKSRLTHFRVILETLVTESAEFFRQQQAVIQYVARHCTATTFCPHSLHTQFIAATHIEHRLYHSHFASHTLPIEKMLILLGRQMHKHTIIGTHRVYEQVGEFIAPETIYRTVIGSLKSDTMPSVAEGRT